MRGGNSLISYKIAHYVSKREANRESKLISGTTFDKLLLCSSFWWVSLWKVKRWTLLISVLPIKTVWSQHEASCSSDIFLKMTPSTRMHIPKLRCSQSLMLYQLIFFEGPKIHRTSQCHCLAIALFHKRQSSHVQFALLRSEMIHCQKEIDHCYWNEHYQTHDLDRFQAKDRR